MLKFQFDGFIRRDIFSKTIHGLHYHSCEHYILYVFYFHDHGSEVLICITSLNVNILSICAEM